MRAYIIRRLLLIIPTLLIVSIVIFLLIRLIPGSAVDAIIGTMEAMTGSKLVVDRAAIEQALGLDQPLLIQYGRWIGVVPQVDGGFSGILQANFGKSIWGGSNVLEEIAVRWPVTIELGFMGLIVAQIIALPIGIYSALRQDTWGDYIGRSIAIGSIAVPGFWLATLVIIFPSLWWGISPPLGVIPFFEDPIGNLAMFITPAIVLGMAMAGHTMRMTRTMMLEVLRQDYIRTAWAKGLKERAVILRHALKNALIPVVTIIGLQMPIMIGGTVIIEQIFVLPGMGRLFLRAVFLRDYPIVSGVAFVFGAGMVLINLIVDLTYGFLDPRVHYK
jgi:peptide/nickel transport system permease protein